ncbi:protein LURP-one-related 7 [Momordica charantia]|uniref:Protein LURP-one-related 7 n=1 Tax=Momordica charantia TaxID=3673 RepID=A0A6J1DNI1_MOMCH|nr:protein LURP-one-related 7 [Momordica charantia]
MANSSSAPATCSAALPIPVDLFLSNKHPDYLTNSSGDIIFRLSRQSSKSPSIDKILLLDAAAAADPLISIHRHSKESWHGFKGDVGEENLLFKVHRSINKLTRTEFKVFLHGENLDDSNASLEMKGWPFQRSCTIYKGNTIVAQTSLMHKLNQVWVRRGRFRLTIFPGSVDPALIVALVVIFFDGRM